MAGSEAALGFGIVTGIFFIILLVIVLSILLFVFWLWMLIDCIKRKFSDDSQKVVWILLMVFLGVIASLIYYFAVYRESKKRKS